MKFIISKKRILLSKKRILLSKKRILLSKKRILLSKKRILLSKKGNFVIQTKKIWHSKKKKFAIPKRKYFHPEKEISFFGNSIFQESHITCPYKLLLFIFKIPFQPVVRSQEEPPISQGFLLITQTMDLPNWECGSTSHLILGIITWYGNPVFMSTGS